MVQNAALQVSAAITTRSADRAETTDHARPFYRPELDALRFFAFLGVFAVHLLNYPVDSLPARHVPRPVATVLLGVVHGGSYGVDLFFVLSAYLITELLLREKQLTGQLHVVAFYARRSLRIWPLYYLAVLGASFIPLFNSHQEFPSQYLAPFLLFVGNWSLMIYGWPLTVATPLWSVSVEEQFYLFWAPMVARLTRRGIAWTAALLIGLANASRLYATVLHQGKGYIWASTFAHLDSIAAGILIALWLRDRSLALSTSMRALMITCGAACFFARGYFIVVPNGDQLSITGTLVGYPAIVLGCAAMLIAFIGLPVRSVSLRYLGKISYGLYVYHVPCLAVINRLFVATPGFGHVMVCLVLVFVMTVVVAALSYELFEKPFLKLKRRFTPIESRPI
jgi:peptidoglycan/LPS O-acetylase OafA/YrhL